MSHTQMCTINQLCIHIPYISHTMYVYTLNDPLYTHTPHIHKHKYSYRKACKVYYIIVVVWNDLSPSMGEETVTRDFMELACIYLTIWGRTNFLVLTQYFFSSLYNGQQVIHKMYYWIKTFKNHFFHTDWRKTENISTKIRNDTRLSTLTTLIQYWRI